MSADPRPAVKHFADCEASAREETVRSLRNLARLALAEAQRGESGARIATHALRSDMREAEHYLVKLDCARAAHDAAVVTAGGNS